MAITPVRALRVVRRPERDYFHELREALSMDNGPFKMGDMVRIVSDPDKKLPANVSVGTIGVVICPLTPPCPCCGVRETQITVIDNDGVLADGASDPRYLRLVTADDVDKPWSIGGVQ
ncbi:hypothetical protein [Asticcacaulis taihuensis]|uniref:hypothetical protein n=1 Tax=Asticcacaulis taihuensis TaxID=260084 RepID=UPI0026F246A4|nr:hypothetical protein [Asticcacaulis taihuensis]